MTDALQLDQVLDCSGLLCPLPVIRTSKAIKKIAIGQVFKVIATDPGAPADMVAWARQTGNELIDAHPDVSRHWWHSAGTRPLRVQRTGALSVAHAPTGRVSAGGGFCVAAAPRTERRF